MWVARHKDTYIGGGSYHGLYGGDARGVFSGGGRKRRGNQMRIYSKPPRRWPRVVLILALVLIFVGCIWQFACGGLPFLNAQAETGGSKLLSTVTDQIGVAKQKAGLSKVNGTATSGLNTQITISAVGDCTFGKDPDFSDSGSFDSYYESNGASYFFANVLPYTSADQLTIANCEGTLTESTDIQEKTYNFKGPAEYANIFVKGSVEAVNLANNHSFDYGSTGYEDTKTNLKNANITSFGYDRYATYEANGVKIGLFGICELDDNTKATSLMKQDIENLKKANCALIIGVFHWGVEGDYQAASSQIEMAHSAVDLGCDLVLGGHPHVLQGVEYYNQRYICYSLGNFSFGGNTNPLDYHTMIFQQTFTIQNGQFVPGDQARKQVRVVPCLVSNTTSVNTYQPTPLSGADGTAAIEQLNSYSSQLAGDGAEFSTALDASGFAQVK
jgi:poly-gamma-glutamate capsule biosynthesis protein CapA/YwtB (metallophosphatase superfamily)